VQRGLTGQYHLTQVAGETIRAFVPLAPDSPLALAPAVAGAATLAPGSPEGMSLPFCQTRLARRGHRTRYRNPASISYDH